MALAGMQNHPPTGNDYLQHFELASIVPAIVLGCRRSIHLRRLARWAWVVPTVILAYELLTFTDPQASVLATHSAGRFDYFFVIQRTMLIFTAGFGGVDLNRVAKQLQVVAPFYSGLAYTLGAITATYGLLRKLFPAVHDHAQVAQTNNSQEEHRADRPEDSVHEVS